MPIICKILSAVKNYLLPSFGCLINRRERGVYKFDSNKPKEIAEYVKFRKRTLLNMLDSENS